MAPKKISVDEMKKHNTVSDGWCSLGNKVSSLVHSPLFLWTSHSLPSAEI